MSFSSFMSSWFLSRCRRFSIKRQNSQSVRTFHKNKLVHIIWWEEYLLKMQINSQVRRVESFARSIFFKSRCCSRARFFQNEWTFKAYKYKTLYTSDQAFYMWNLLYISKLSDERSSFIAANNTEFMRNSQSWNFETREKKNFVVRSPCFSGSDLRPSGAKTASRLTRIGLAYHASWGCG
jgi:hypothetical protein